MHGVRNSYPMKTIRRPDEAAPEKMSTFHKINSEFGAWSRSIPSIMVSDDMEDEVCPGGAAPAPSPATATTATRPCRPFNNPRAHVTPRHAKIDKFIEGLESACEALPTPLVGSASGPPPPSSRPTTSRDCSSSSQDRQPYRHPHHHHRRHYHRKSHQEDRPPHPTGVVKEVKFADEVIEIGHSEAPRSSERSILHDYRHPARSTESGARGSRGGALRFDYRKRRSEFVKAATVVQSTYRGYKVRRGQPLKYLIIINGVKEKLEELRQQLDAWKIAAWFPTDLTERATMTESVMDLLLQLDSLQGIPVVVREFRKTVARDVIKFQEEVDGFLCRNSKHGVLFDLTRPEGRAVQGGSNLKPSKTIRNIVVQKSSLGVDNVRESNSKAYTGVHNEGRKEEGKGGGTKAGTDVKSDFKSDCHSKIVDDPSYSNSPHGCSEQNFVLWSPRNYVEEVRDGEAKQLDCVTELGKCVASTGNVDDCIPPPEKKKKSRVRFGMVNFANRSFGKEHLSTTAADECSHSFPLDTSPGTSTHHESWRKDMHPPSHAPSREFTGSCPQKEHSKCKVSINKQRSLDIPKDCKTANVHLVEDCEIRHPQQLPQPDHSPREMWEAQFPADLYCDNLMEIDKTCFGTESALAHPFELTRKMQEDLQTVVEVVTSKDLSDKRDRKNKTGPQGFSSHGDYEQAKDVIENITEHKSSTDMENTQSIVSSPPHEIIEGLPKTERVSMGDPYHDDLYGGNRARLPPSPDTEYMLAKDVREGTIEPLLTSNEKDDDINYPITASKLELSPKAEFQFSGGHEYTDSAPQITSSMVSQPGLDFKGRDSCTTGVFLQEGEQVQKPGSPSREPIEIEHRALLRNFEIAQMLTPSTSILRDHNIREEIDGEAGNKYELCGFDDLETISSCSCCAAYPAEGMGEPCDLESSVHEDVPHQPYALNGLPGKVEEMCIERSCEDKREVEGSFWKDEVWRDYVLNEFQPFESAGIPIASQPSFERELEVVRNNDSWKSFDMLENAKGKGFDMSKNGKGKSFGMLENDNEKSFDMLENDKGKSFDMLENDKGKSFGMSENDEGKSFGMLENDKGKSLRETAQKQHGETQLDSSHERYGLDIKESTYLDSNSLNQASTSWLVGEEGGAFGSVAIVSNSYGNNVLLTKLVEDNKRLKELLKEEMKWNTVQATAMITLNERLELVESKK